MSPRPSPTEAALPHVQTPSVSRCPLQQSIVCDRLKQVHVRDVPLRGRARYAMILHNQGRAVMSAPGSDTWGTANPHNKCGRVICTRPCVVYCNIPRLAGPERTYAHRPLHVTHDQTRLVVQELHTYLSHLHANHVWWCCSRAFHGQRCKRLPAGRCSGAPDHESRCDP
jgi:hypothetical protein